MSTYSSCFIFKLQTYIALLSLLLTGSDYHKTIKLVNMSNNFFIIVSIAVICFMIMIRSHA